MGGGDLRQLLTTALPLLIFPLIFCMRSRVRAGQLMTAILILIMMRRPTMTTNSRTHMYAPHPTRYISTPAQTHHSLLCTHARNAFDLICLLRPNRHIITPADTVLVIAINADLRGYVGKRAEIRILKHVIDRCIFQILLNIPFQ